ncbi:MAG: ASKHA domain-containing protein, partial [Candidatus Sumerlaeota bacterium]
KIHCGMMASAGAINKIGFDGDDLTVETLNGKAPRGVCGSGLIEVFARGVETGLIQMNGRITLPDAADSLPEKLAARLASDNGKEARILLTPGQHGLSEVFISQTDVREFQLGKGAVQTAILMVLEEVGIAIDQIDSFLVAGAFGNHLNPEDAITLGLLPDVPRERFFFIGNSSLEGARCILLNRFERYRAEKIAESSQFVELATRPEFQERFAMSMMLGPAMMF